MAMRMGVNEEYSEKSVWTQADADGAASMYVYIQAEPVESTGAFSRTRVVEQAHATGTESWGLEECSWVSAFRETHGRLCSPQAQSQYLCD